MNTGSLFIDYIQESYVKLVIQNINHDVRPKHPTGGVHKKENPRPVALLNRQLEHGPSWE